MFGLIYGLAHKFLNRCGIIEVKRDNKNNLKHPMLNTNNRVGVIASGLQIYY